jgi:hypothetical protein
MADRIQRKSDYNSRSNQKTQGSGTTMAKSTTVAGLMATLLVFAWAHPAHADSTPTTCQDGTTTTSTGKGTCSGHGGIQKAAKPAAAAPAAAPAAAAPAAPAKAPAAPAKGAPTTCADGTTSTSTGKGTCSGHGGVQKASTAKPVAAATTPPPAAAPAATAAKSSTVAKTATAGNTDPTGATAKCKDGTYSKSTHRSGTCSSHGGVDTWLTAPQ